MDELVEDFLVETKESLEELDNDIITLEQNPDDEEIIGKIFRIMHTIKGTCGFLGMSRLEAIAHAGEDIFDKIRDKELSITPEIISRVFESLDAIKNIMNYIEATETEPEGDDSDLIARLRKCAEGGESLPPQTPEAAEAPNEAEAEPKKEEESEKAPAEEATKEEKPTTNNQPPGDSDELQALFDATEPLVDTGQEPKTEDKKEPQKAAEPKTETKTAPPSGDSDELQALFDSTESLVEIEKKPEAEAKPSKEAKPAAEIKPPAAKNTQAKKTAATQTIRVNLDILENLMQKASELVLTRNQLMQIMRKQQNPSFNTAVQRLNSITTELQESVMKTRMQPIGNAWTKLPRIIRDLSVDLNKKIDLKMSGEDTELDRHLLEAITDPLTHMVRNSADHGIETPEDRAGIGKPETGTIHISAYHGGGYIIMEISDDGNGIDAEVIKKKAIEKGLVSENDANSLTDSQIYQFIFAPGFSTAAAVTSVSGRGVGMDVVKTNIESISGTISLDSKLGRGSTFTIKIPLTLAIMPILQVATNGQKFAIPQINVMEIVKASGKNGYKIETINNKPILRLRQHLLPLVSLSESLGMEKFEFDEESQPRFVVVCEVGEYHFGIIVDEVFETEEIVVKPVSPILQHIDVYSGCTILGDGSVILILDPNGMAKQTGDVVSGRKKQALEEKEEKHLSEESTFIVFKAGDTTPKVIPLELIARLEEIEVNSIEYSRGEPVVQYRGDLMRIIQIDSNYQIPQEGVIEMLVLINGNKTMGLVVEEVLDIAKCVVSHELAGGSHGFLGSVVIDDKTCDVVDVGHYFKEAFAEYEEKQEKSTNGHNILFVDDSPFFRKFVPPELVAAGYNVEVCSNAKDAIIKLENGTNFSAVITDMNMPGMDGDEFAAVCKDNERFNSLPFIALSSTVEEGKDNSKTLGSQFDAFVSKTNHKAITEVLSSVLAKEAA